MANKNNREIRFVLTDEDYSAFGRYRIMYTKGGRALVRRQRITYIFSGIMIAVLFTVFHVDPAFQKLAYAAAALIGAGGAVFAERIVLKQQDKAIKADQNNADRIHPDENIVRLGDEELETRAGNDSQSFRYKDIKLIDLTEESIYVWMSDTMIMPIPAHAFRNMDEMKEAYGFINKKIKEQGGDAADGSVTE